MVKVVPPKRKKSKAGAKLGPVSTISTAPVAIGNSIRGATADVTQLPDGARIVGRDFGFSLNSTAATLTNWELVGAMPITPCVLPSTVLRNYAQMFGFFKVNKLMVHYITASATSQTGDIMFYYERDRYSPLVDYSNTSFLPFVLSDSNTVIGPQWTNHTLVVDPIKEFKSTAYGLSSDLNHDATGTVMVFSKTSSTTSPGYILIDYDITFKSLSVNPRAGMLPIARGQFSCISIGDTARSATAGSTAIANLVIQGEGLDNATMYNMPSGAASGDIYKVVVAATASVANNVWTNVTLSNLLVSPNALDTAVTVDDGFTCYMRWADTTSGGGDVPQGRFFPSLDAALAGSNSYLYGVTNASVTWTLICNISLVGTLQASFLQASY